METSEVNSDGIVSFSLRVKNIGSRDGEEVVQVYVSDEESSILRPYIEFAGCKRVFLATGEEKIVRFTMRADQFSFMGTDDRWIVEKEKMTVRIGSSSDDIRLKAQFCICDSAYVRPARRGFFAKSEVIVDSERQ